MAALPYIQLYVADYLADTMHLEAEEHGAYLMLIFNYWQTGKPIPKARAQAISRVPNERWNSVEQKLNEFFNDTGTHWQHNRIDEDLLRVEGKQSEASKAGKASAAARRSKKLAEAQRTLNARSTNVDDPLQQNGNHTDTDTDTEEDKEKPLVPSADGTSDYSQDFEKLWKAYPKRDGNNSKKAAWKAWKARTRSGVPANDLILAASRYAEQMRSKGNIGTSFVKTASAFLGPDEHWAESLKSNVHEFRAKGDRPALREGEFYHPEWDAGVHEVCRDGVHSRETGYPTAFSR